MILFPDDDTQVIRESSHFEIIPSIVVENLATGEEVDISDRLSEPDGWDIAASQNDSCGTAQATFERDAGSSGPLSPLSAFSSAVFGDGRPFFDPGVALKIWVAVRGTVPAFGITDVIGGVPQLIFYGRIDRVPVAAGEDRIQVKCRDFGAYLLNTMIQSEETRGDALMEDVIRGIVTDYSPVVMAYEAPVASDFFIEPYTQRPGSVLEACRIIAQQRGWDIRWFTGAGELKLYEPDREGIDFLQIDPIRYEKITELEVADDDLRNWWHIYWTDADGVIHGPAEAKDDASILRYGPRFARIYIDRAYNIRTEANADAFAQAALLDTKDPLVSNAIQLPFFPEVELGDLHSYTTADGAYTGGLTGSVVQYSHAYRNGHANTVIGIRPRALAAYRDYRLSVPPKILVSTVTPTTEYAPEGTLMLVTDSLAFP